VFMFNPLMSTLFIIDVPNNCKLPVCVSVVTRGCLECLPTMKMHWLTLIADNNVDGCDSFSSYKMMRSPVDC
jgi:hypothetical protein